MTSETVVVELGRDLAKRLTLGTSGERLQAVDELQPVLHAALASDSQGGAYCDGYGSLVHPPSQFDIEHGESRRLHTPCPGCAKCQPEQGGDGDWPEILAARQRPGDRPLLDSTGKMPPRWKRIETRRYIPAPGLFNETAAVEELAAALCIQHQGDGERIPWSEIPEAAREKFRHNARAVLGTAPFRNLLAQYQPALPPQAVQGEKCATCGGSGVSLRPSAIAVSNHGAMYAVIDAPDDAEALLIPCSWEHRHLEARDELKGDRFELHPAQLLRETQAALKGGGG